MEVNRNDPETLAANTKALRDRVAREMIEEEILLGKREKPSPEEMEAAIAAITDEEIEAFRVAKNRRHLKIQFRSQLIEKVLADKAIGSLTATPDQIEAAGAQVTEDELDAVLDGVLEEERMRTDMILKREQEARAARLKAELEKNGAGEVKP